MGRAQRTAAAAGSAVGRSEAKAAKADAKAEAKANRLILAATLNPADRAALATWSSQLAWPEAATIKEPDSFHVTVSFCKCGGQDPVQRAWMMSHTGSFELVPAEVEVFTGVDPDKAAPVVLRFASPQLEVLADQVYTQALERGLDPQRHDARFNAHVTLGFATSAPAGVTELPPPMRNADLTLWD